MNRRNKPKGSKPPKKLEFGVVGVVAGLLFGIVAGVALGMMTKPSLPLTQAMALAGALLGALGEAIRFWWRKKRQREGAKLT